MLTSQPRVDHLSSFTDRWSGPLVAEVHRAVELVAPALTRSLASLVRGPLDSKVFLRNRLFALAVREACGEDPADALPVSVVSALWWAGAEEIDDMADSGAVAGLTGAIAALSLVPQHYLASLELPPTLMALWNRDVVRSCLLAAEGQLAEQRDRWTCRDAVLECYRGKTGAAYARDAAMAARLGGRVADWERFGNLFGVLRQLHNDNHPGTAQDNEDLANATPTLWMMHAHLVTPPAQVSWLRRLRALARTDVPSRIELDAYLRSDAVLSSYHADIRALHATACDMLSSLDADGSVLRAYVDHAAASA